MREDTLSNAQTFQKFVFGACRKIVAVAGKRNTNNWCCVSRPISNQLTVLAHQGHGLGWKVESGYFTVFKTKGEKGRERQRETERDRERQRQRERQSKRDRESYRIANSHA